MKKATVFYNLVTESPVGKRKTSSMQREYEYDDELHEAILRQGIISDYNGRNLSSDKLVDVKNIRV